MYFIFRKFTIMNNSCIAIYLVLIILVTANSVIPGNCRHRKLARSHVKIRDVSIASKKKVADTVAIHKHSQSLRKKRELVHAVEGRDVALKNGRGGKLDK